MIEKIWTGEDFFLITKKCQGNKNTQGDTRL